MVFVASWSDNVKLHKSSALFNFSTRDLPNCICCDEISRGQIGQPMIKSATAVNPVLLLLLCNNVDLIQSASEDVSLFKISNSITLTCPHKQASVMMVARKVLVHNVISIVEKSFVDVEFQVSLTPAELLLDEMSFGLS